MGVVSRIGKVSVVEKSGRLYLRANLPGVGNKWIKTGCPAEEIKKAQVLGQELDTDLGKVSFGIPFPLEKYVESKSELDVVREQLGLSPGKGKEAEVFLHWLRVYEKEHIPTLAISSQYGALRQCQWIREMVNKGQQLPGRQTFNQRLSAVIKEECSVAYQRTLFKTINAIVRMYLPEMQLLALPSTGKKKSKTIRAFTVQERDAIINGFFEMAIGRTPQWRYDLTLYGHYARICFLCGCRPGEGAGLDIPDIDLTSNRIVFHQRYGAGEGGYSIQPGLKTQDERIFPVNPQLRRYLLEAIAFNRQHHGHKEMGLFTRYDGGRIIDARFRHRWEQVIFGLGISYRKPYYMRHTFISHCLERGIPVATVAQWVGNSAKTIYAHYAGVSDLDVPEL